MAQPEDLRVVDDVSFRAGIPVRPVLFGPIQISTAIAAFYRGESPPAEGEDGASALAETPIVDGDTAPVFNDLQKAVAESLDQVEPKARDEDGDVTVPQLDEETEPPPPPAPVEKPRDVPTRDILHALTQLLIEKEVIGRQELLERVAANRKRSAS